MSVGHHSITIKWKNVYTFGMTKWFKRGSEIYRLWEWTTGDRSKEDTIHLSTIRQSSCLRKWEVLSQSVRRTSFNNNKVKDVYTFGKSKCLKSVSEIYRLWEWAIVDRI